MPPKITFTKEQILESAFKIFKGEGLENVSVRKIASELGSSTAPIYTSFGNIEEMKRLLMGKALKLLISYTEQAYTGDVFLNIGVGMLEFARDNKIIYRSLFINTNEHHSILQEFFDRCLLQMKKEKSLQVFEEQDLKKMLEKMFFFTHGLAACLCAGMLEDTSRDFLTRTLEETGGDVIGACAFRKGLVKEYLNAVNEGSCQNEKNHHPEWDHR